MTAFRQRYRLHQAKWREAHGHPIGTQPYRPLPGRPVREVGSRLVDIHGQSQHMALLRQRENNKLIDVYLILAVWTLPVTMMLAGLIYIPLTMLVLPAFVARLVWQLARCGTQQRVEGAVAGTHSLHNA
jgi:hypothetical protein